MWYDLVDWCAEMSSEIKHFWLVISVRATDDPTQLGTTTLTTHLHWVSLKSHTTDSAPPETNTYR